MTTTRGTTTVVAAALMMGTMGAAFAAGGSPPGEMRPAPVESRPTPAEMPVEVPVEEAGSAPTKIPDAVVRTPAKPREGCRFARPPEHVATREAPERLRPRRDPGRRYAMCEIEHATRPPVDIPRAEKPASPGPLTDLP